MPEVCVRVGASLDLSMYPSFVSSLFARVGRGRWVKLVGFREGVELYEREGMWCCRGRGCDDELLRYLAGLWCRPHGPPPPLTNTGVRRVAARLALVASPWDREALAVAVFLSRRTSYVVNVVRWVRTLLRGAADPDTGSVDVDVVRRRARGFSSYQVRQLEQVLDELVKAVEGARGPEQLRARLLRVRYVGPKVADATLLFVGASCSVAPYDTHLARLLREEGLDARPPTKQMCLRHGPWCPSCGLRDTCASGVAVNRFGGWAGTVQTAAYVFYSLGGDLSRLEPVLRRFAAPL